MKDTVYSNFKAQVLRAPAAPAVISGGKTYSYSELDAMADAIMSRFPERGCPCAGIVMEHGVQMIASMLAVLKSGAAYVPAEPSFPPERIRYMMRESAAGFILTSGEASSALSGFRTVPVGDVLPEEGHGAEAPDRSEPDGLAYILYTSGTTGRPKGVMVENRNVCHYARAFREEFNPGLGDVMLQYSVCTFDIFVEEVFTTLLSGAALAIPSPEERKDIPSLMRFAEASGVSEISGFPYLLLELNRLPVLPSSLRLLISGGDVLREAYVSNLTGRVKVYNTYGPSETTVCASYYDCSAGKALPDGTYPVGKAVKGSRMAVMDGNLRELPAGETGEICILGDGVTRGYLGGKPEQENFVTLPTGERLYRSGDLGYVLPDGNMAFLHRKDEQVMILGKRVECGEVENVLCACDEVEGGAVRAFTDGGGLSYLVAYFVPKGNFSLSALKSRMRMFLTDFMIPEFFVQMPAMPLTENGKIDRKALPAVLKEGTLHA